MRIPLLAALLAVSALAQAPAPRPAPVPNYTELKFPPLKPIQIPPVATYTLANGIRLYLLEDHELPLVRGVALVRTGNLFDPPAKIGLADLTGTVMRSGGTRAKTGDQLDQELEDIAASVETGIGETSGSVSFSCLKENTGEVLGIFHDVLTDPQFRPDKLELAKSQYRSGISRRNDDPEGILQREFRDTLYGHHTPYGWRMEYATVDAIQRADLLDFYHRYFFPANIILAVYGDFSIPEMKARLEKLLDGWTVQQPPVPAVPKVREAAAPGVFLATKTDVTQTFFAMGQLADQLNDPDEPALEVMADILGGGFQSRLVQKVRTRLGYAYNISADWAGNYDHPGVFEISGSTKSASTTETIEAIQEEVARIRSGLVTEEELHTAKDTALNSLVFAFDSKSKTLNRLLTYEYFGYPKDFIQRYQKALAAVTRADVLRVAQKHLKPESFTMVAVGNPARFGKPLATLGLPITSIDLTIPEPPAQAPAGRRAGEESNKQP